MNSKTEWGARFFIFKAPDGYLRLGAFIIYVHIHKTYIHVQLKSEFITKGQSHFEQ